MTGPSKTPVDAAPDGADGPSGAATMQGLLRGDPFEATFEAAGVGLAIVDLTGRHVRVNDAFAKLHACEPEDLIGTELQFDGDLLRTLLDKPPESPPVRLELELREDLWASIGVSLRHDPEGRPTWYVVDAEDVTRRLRAERDLEHRAMHDDLTGLPNRVLVLDRLRLALARSQRGAGDVGVLFCDLDGFKAINDRHGHLLGDLVLRVVATRLSGVVRPSDTVGRLGGDEFVIVVEPPVHDQDLERLAERLTAAIEAPLRERGTDTRVGVSVGVARSHGGATSPERLLERADTAMYEAKRAKRPGSGAA